MVTRKEYQEITGRKYPPKGSGLSSSRNPGAAKGTNSKSVPLPPQDFNWLNVTPIEEGENPYGNNSHNLIGFHMDLFDFARFFDLYENKVMTVKQVSEKMKIRERKLHNFVSKLSLYEDDGVAEQWTGVLKRLWDIQTHRGKTHIDDELMMDGWLVVGSGWVVRSDACVRASDRRLWRFVSKMRVPKTPKALEYQKKKCRKKACHSLSRRRRQTSSTHSSLIMIGAIRRQSIHSHAA